ncbi:MAG: SEC-C metal-binding domain-containing protein [Gallionella sp.]|nr:SEC-C metal-binding domain-containing protein [Gallionella sp.]
MQHTLISQAATLLDDPIMMEWAVHYYHDLPPHPELKGQLENLWFHDVIIKRWMDADDPDVLSLMFLYLPAQRFSMFASAMSSRWGAWPSQLTNSAAGILASVSPELAVETFGRYLETVQPWSVEKAAAILATLDKLPPEAALPLLEKLLPLAWDQDEMIASFIRYYAFKAAVRLIPQVLPRLLDGLYAENGHRLNRAVESMANCLFGHDAYADLYFLRREDYDVAFFSDLAQLFDSDAPLANMDEVMRSETPLAAALRLLEAHHGRSPESDLAWEAIRHSEVFRKEEHPVELAALALAGVAAAFERKTIDATLLSIEDALALLALDVCVNIHYDALVEKLRSFPHEEIAATMAIRIGEVKDTYGGVTLARLMGDLCRAEFIQPLIGCIGETKGDFLCEAAMNALLNIGEPARDALIAQWGELDATQKIYGGSVIAGVGGDAVADFALGRFDELIRADIERFCDLVQSAPDARLLERLRPELRRKQSLIDKTYYRLCRLLDEEGEDLLEVHERILRERKRQQVALQNFNKGDFVSNRQTLRLSLRCTACGEVNGYDVKGVSMGDGGGKPLVADEFPCLSCGALAEFELEPMAFMALTAEMLRLQVAREAGEENITPLISVDMVTASGGTAQPLTVAYADLREKIRNNPGDWLSLFRLGNILRRINRPKAALDSFKKAHAINPLSLETIINLAAALIKFNQKSDAFELLGNTLKQSANWQTIASHPAEKGWEFAQLFNQLRRDLGRNDLPALHPGFLGVVPKVGRNDPCPCGSGKKFKKCCIK